MSLLDTARVRRIQRRTGFVRNLCVVAHVDHGKTTFTDILIATNGIIHPRQAGKLRYLDSREDEQERCITMKASAISLVYPKRRASHPGQPAEGAPAADDYLINVIDSPGHVDFCSEVSSAVRVCDGAVVLVDAAEGVCIQTRAVLRQAWEERLKMTLFINKVDRLVSELGLAPVEAYDHLRRIIEEVNLIVDTFESEKFISETNAAFSRQSEGGAHDGTGEGGDVNDESFLRRLAEEQEGNTFHPSKGNVAFGSALDGWGFRVGDFAALYATKLGFSERALRQALWGDYYLQPKTRKIVGRKAAQGTRLKPLFAQLVLDPIWRAYSALRSEDAEAIERICTTMNLQVVARELTHSDERVRVRAVMMKWLPLPRAVLAMAVDSLPAPDEAAQYKIPHLLHDQAPSGRSDTARPRAATDPVLWRSLCACSVDSETVAYVSKMFAVATAELPADAECRRLAEEVQDEQVFIGFARVYAGLLRTGQSVYIIPPDHVPPSSTASLRAEHASVPSVVIRELFLLMGREFVKVDSVPAGNVVGIGGIEQHVLKNATMASTLLCPSFVPMQFQSAPIVKVAVEPLDASRFDDLIQGLEALNQADPFVEIEARASGEYVVGAAGEVHLARCVKDLEERFAKMELRVSPPLVSFKETIAWDGPPLGEWAAEGSTPNGRCKIRVMVRRLPTALAEALTGAANELKALLTSNAPDQGPHPGDVLQEIENRIEQANSPDADKDVARGCMKDLLSRAWALGPRKCGPNILFAGSSTGGPPDTSFTCNQWVSVGALEAASAFGLRPAGAREQSHGPGAHDSADRELAVDVEIIASGVHNGFQMATSSGPLCDEQLWGLGFEVQVQVVEQAAHIDAGDDASTNGEPPRAEDQYGPFSGQVTATVKDALKAAVEAAGARLVEAMYLCEVSASAEALGGVYAVLGRRRARILKEDMREGSATFVVLAHIPVAESFGIADEIRIKTSGAAAPQLVFSHWEPLQGSKEDVDPYFVPVTEEEREEFGEQSESSKNLARRYVDLVRKRKGLMLDARLVESATKQRTRARKV